MPSREYAAQSSAKVVTCVCRVLTWLLNAQAERIRLNLRPGNGGANAISRCSIWRNGYKPPWPLPTPVGARSYPTERSDRDLLGMRPAVCQAPLSISTKGHEHVCHLRRNASDRQSTTQRSRSAPGSME